METVDDRVKQQDQALTPIDAADDFVTDELHETSPLTYARSCGLTSSYLTETPFPPAETRVKRVQNASWEDHVAVMPAFEEDITCQLSERLTVSARAVQLLREICTQPEASILGICDLEKTVTVASLKQELPLLRSDNEYDMMHFGAHENLDFSSIDLKLMLVDEEKDEGLTWPSSCLELPARTLHNLGREKLEVDQDALKLLYSALKDADNAPELSEYDLGIRLPGLNRSRSVTPPLLPLSPPITPFFPAIPITGIVPLSDPVDWSDAEAEAIEQRLLDEDAIGHQRSTMTLDNNTAVTEAGELQNVLDFIAETPMNSPPPKRKIRDLRVEAPLTPQPPTNYSNKRIKTGLHPEMLHEHIHVARSSTIDDPSLEFEENDTHLIQLEMAHFATKADDLIRNERLIAADATRRVKVPEVETRKLVLPWQQHSGPSNDRSTGGRSMLKVRCTILERAKEEDFHYIRQWHSNAKLHLQLSWTPFALDLAKVNVDESINSTVMLGTAIDQEQSFEKHDSAPICYKREGLRILDDAWDSDDKELEPAILEAEHFHLDDAVRKKRTTNEVTGPEVREAQGKVMDQAYLDKEQAPTAFLGASGRKSHVQDAGLMFGGGIFSAADIAKSLNNGSRASQHAIDLPDAHHLPSILATRHGHDQNGQVQVVSKRPQLPSPAVPLNLPSRPVVIRSGLLTSHRDLIRHIQEIYPGIILIEREWNYTIPTLDAHSVRRERMPDEGDMLISPSTSVILTTIARIKQRSLPGQERSHYGVKDRIAAVADRVERVVVFVSDSMVTRLQSARDLDRRDTLALADLTGFGTSLHAEIEILYVAGGDVELARWIVCIMARYAVVVAGALESTKLLQEQTLWEMFLRRAGFNAFAAQIVLDTLKLPASAAWVAEGSSTPLHNQDQTVSSGLSAFITMTPPERLKRLQVVLGGHRILNKVNDVISKGWQG